MQDMIWQEYDADELSEGEYSCACNCSLHLPVLSSGTNRRADRLALLKFTSCCRAAALLARDIEVDSQASRANARGGPAMCQA